jgi:hypothetical protein
MVHVRYDGTSRDVPRTKLDVSREDTDPEILRAVARHLEVEPETLDGYTVDRPDSGALIVRPEAVYG